MFYYLVKANDSDSSINSVIESVVPLVEGDFVRDTKGHVRCIVELKTNRPHAELIISLTNRIATPTGSVIPGANSSNCPQVA